MGKSGIRTLAYLGSIAPDAIERASARAEFWYQVTSNLDQLARSVQLTEEELAKLTRAIAQKVQPVEAKFLLSSQERKILGRINLV